jgi:hypothetical protein
VWSAMCEVITSSVPIEEIIGSAISGRPAGSIMSYRLNGSVVAGNTVPGVGSHLIEAVFAITTTGSVDPRIGISIVSPNNYSADIRFWALQFEVGTARSPYQRRGTTATPDITESGVTSFGLISMDGSDDALLHQLAAGGTVSVALFGRGGSYLIPSITLAAPSVLQLGPLSVLDDGVLVSGCPTGILRAVGTVPWSSRFELVGYAIMKANPTDEEQARAMRYFAAFGARGWLVEGPELVTNGGFDDATGWTLGAGWSIGGGTLNSVEPNNITAAAISVAFEAGIAFRVRYTLSPYTSGAVRAELQGGGSDNGSSRNSSGNVDEIIAATAQRTAFRFLASGGTGLTASIDNVSVRALTPEF